MKGVAVYGHYITYEPVRQRYWKRRSDGVKQRYWKKTTRMMKVEKAGRYEFEGPGRELYRSVIEAYRALPRGYVEVSTREYLQDPASFAVDGYWIKKDVDS